MARHDGSRDGMGPGWRDRLGARLAGMGRRAAAPIAASGSRGIGSVARGRQLIDGRFLFAGYMVEARDTSLWDLPVPDAAFGAELHGFGWLDDLAAAGTDNAAAHARSWTHDWIRRFDGGRGPGWTPVLTGRRLGRWIDHAGMLTDRLGARQTARFHRALHRQWSYLRRRAGHAPVGLARFEALAGALLAGMALGGKARSVDALLDRFQDECAAHIAADGTIPGRNPEEAMETFALLARVSEALADAGRPAADEVDIALRRMAPVLRTLRHADGGLARFHGGGRGAEGRLDHALAASRVRPGPPLDGAMGFARLSHGRTTLILDAAPPPSGAGAESAHASTLAFELTSGRRPLIVGSGSGRTFDGKWRRAARATSSHSTLALDGSSSARLGPSVARGGRQVELLCDGPRDVRIERQRDETGSGLIAGHDGYLRSHGLTHVRQLHLSIDGRSLRGEDLLTTIELEDEAMFDRAKWNAGGRRFPFRIHFHLHPDVVVQRPSDRRTVLLALKSGEVWDFRHTGAAAVTVEPGVYLETHSLVPRPAAQIVLASTAVEYATRVSWTLAKARQTPDALRDLAPDAAEPDLPVPA
ncbi:heparinase II/III family protein [Oceaniovalibus guishaninsula]|nr:heparinase II/III family protein [Oceaniovalibus guishaninsula]